MLDRKCEGKAELDGVDLLASELRSRESCVDLGFSLEILREFGLGRGDCYVEPD